MDYAVTGNVDYSLNNMWTSWLSGSTSSYTLANSSGATEYVMPAKLLGYGGAALTAFLSIAGAITAGTTSISAVETSFFSVLEDYQDGVDWDIIYDDELGP
jgi:hypothetical protein